MNVKVAFYGDYQKLFGSEEKRVELPGGATARDLIESLCSDQACRDQIFDEQGKKKCCVEILRKGSKLEFINEDTVALEEGDVVAIFPNWGV